MSPGIDQDKIWWLLEGCLVQVSASTEWLERRILPLSLDQFRWRPSSTQWSIAECLDHLNRTFDYYLSKVDEAFEKGRNGEPFRFLESEDEFLRQMEPPVVVTMKAPPLLLPAPAIDLDRIVDQFPDLRIRYAKAVQSLADVNVLGVSVPDAVHPPIQTLGGVIALLAAHERRHLWQTQQILRTSDFPAHLAARPSTPVYERR